MYMEQLPYEPYPIQEEAILSWFTAEQGVLVCAPTGTGKTLIAEAALYEALHTGKTAYYTTPLIALTDQKFEEMKEAAVKWGFSADDVGLVTGNRQVNPNARILVVVAEILFNRLLHREAFDFDDVCAVVMDEFHSFNDRERGIVWEFSLGILPEHVRTLLLSATVGNAQQFIQWLRHRQNRKLDLVQGTERKVPLTFEWVGDSVLSELIETMATGEAENRRTPALIFCFNREECWTIGELLKGRKLLQDGQQKALVEYVDRFDWSEGAGPKMKRLLLRGVGVHHAGVLPRYRRIVEELFQQKLLAVAVCTETLSAGINLPARSVVMPNLLKGPPGDKKVIDPASAHQIFGRAGRPQYDTCGFVYVLAHEDDVKIARWRVKYDQIPEDTKDPGLRKAKKALKKKMPKRRTTQQYWTEGQFEKLRDAKPAGLASRGRLPWRLLAYMLDASPDVEPVRQLVSRRLLTERQVVAAQKDLDRMLQTLWRAGYVRLEPEPQKPSPDDAKPEEPASPKKLETESTGLLAGVLSAKSGSGNNDESGGQQGPPDYQAKFAYPTEAMTDLLQLRGVNPLYGIFLVKQLGVADQAERLQAFESLMVMPGSIARSVRVPSQEDLPPGPLATTRLDSQLLRMGLASAEELADQKEDEDSEDQSYSSWKDRTFVLTLAEKLMRLFEHDFPDVHDVRITSVWVAGELLEFGGDFNKYITTKGLQKQEGMIFRHILRLILLIAEFEPLCPPDADPIEWRDDLKGISDALVISCRKIDPLSTEKILEEAAEIGQQKG